MLFKELKKIIDETTDIGICFVSEDEPETNCSIGTLPCFGKELDEYEVEYISSDTWEPWDCNSFDSYVKICLKCKKV